MNGVFVRKSVSGMLRYFGDDFGSSMWQDETGAKLFIPRIGGLRRGDASVLPWRELLKNDFLVMVKEIHLRRKTGGIMGMELAFAPPKSVSVAGLADVRVSAPILEANAAAVNDAVGFLSRQLVARAKGALVDCEVRLLEFPHPWNRAQEPQLHYHLLVLRSFNSPNALWTTVVFLLQRAMREVYHYSLCSRLLGLGFGLRLGEPGSLTWELEGVPGHAIEYFSERSRKLRELALSSPRGYFSLGAELRVAGWVSRRSLPKTDPAISLADARLKWRKEVPSMQLLGPSKRIETVEVDLKRIFRLSSVLTREQFVAAHLRWWMGARAPLEEAVKMADAILLDHVRRGRLLRSGSVYCYPEGFATEGAIVAAISSDYDQAKPVTLNAGGSLDRLSLEVLKTSHAVKVISTYGEAPPAAKDLRDGRGQPFAGLVKHMKFWDSAEVFQATERRNEQPFIIFVEEPLWVGDFGARAGRMLAAGLTVKPVPNKPFLFQRRRIVVRKGDLAKTPEAEDKPSLWQRLERRFLPQAEFPDADRPTVVLAPSLTAEEAYQLNRRRLFEAAKGNSHMVKVLRLVSWERLFEGQWEGLGIFAIRREKVFPQIIRRGQLWFFTGGPAGGVVEAVGIKRRKMIPVQALRAVAESQNPQLALVERVELPLVPGVPLLSPMRFESDHQIFRPGEVQILTAIGKDGSLRFGERFWPCDHILLEPAFYVREFAVKQPSLPVIALQVEPGRNPVRLLEALPPAGLTIVSTSRPEEICQRLETNIHGLSRARKMDATRRAISGEWMEELYPLFPRPAVWDQLLRERAIAKERVPAPEVREVSPTSTNEGIAVEKSAEDFEAFPALLPVGPSFSRPAKAADKMEDQPEKTVIPVDPPRPPQTPMVIPAKKKNTPPKAKPTVDGELLEPS